MVGRNPHLWSVSCVFGTKKNNTIFLNWKIGCLQKGEIREPFRFFVIWPYQCIIKKIQSRRLLFTSVLKNCINWDNRINWDKKCQIILSQNIHPPVYHGFYWLDLGAFFRCFPYTYTRSLINRKFAIIAPTKLTRLFSRNKILTKYEGKNIFVHPYQIVYRRKFSY